MILYIMYTIHTLTYLHDCVHVLYFVVGIYMDGCIIMLLIGNTRICVIVLKTW